MVDFRDGWLTVREAADRLGVTGAAVRNWARIGKLPAVKVGSSIRISADDLAKVVQPAQVVASTGGED